MNYVILNGNIRVDSDVNILINNRAFQYGDSLFETIVFSKGKIRLWQYHWERLSNGMQILNFDFAKSIDSENLSNNISQLLSFNNVQNEARIKLQVWRKPGGLYLPKDNEIEYLAVCNPLTDNYGIKNYDTVKVNVGFCDTIKLNYSIISGLKTCNSIPYVLAAIEREQKGLNDIIITDNYGNISECCSSNIFWWDGRKIFTPAMESGCIAGVMRKYLLTHLRETQQLVEEGLFPKIMLKEAKAVFTTNCTGIRLIDKLIFDDKDSLSLDHTAFIRSPVFSSIQSLF